MELKLNEKLLARVLPFEDESRGNRGFASGFAAKEGLAVLTASPKNSTSFRARKPPVAVKITSMLLTGVPSSDLMTAAMQKGSSLGLV